MKQKAIVLMSGGLDSSVLALHMQEVEKREVIGLSINYGQRHSRELVAAAVVADILEIRRIEIQAAGALLGLFVGADSSQVGNYVDVPEGHYAAENMKLTLVPNRNMMLIAMAGALAISRGAEAIALAIHAGDHAIYPDCRPEFYHRMNQALAEATTPPVEQPVRLYAPFVMMGKHDIVKHAASLFSSQIAAEALFAATWSCYQNGLTYHCGKCGTCVERKEAFQLAGVQDPTFYEGRI